VQDLNNINTEIAENELCPVLKQKRVALLEDLVYRARNELELSAREVRKYSRRPCEDCMRCNDKISIECV